MSKSEQDLGKQRSALAALDQIRAELYELPEHELLHQNVVPLTALVTVRRIHRELRGLRKELLNLPTFDIAYLDRLELYALAFVGAQSRYDTLREHNQEPETLLSEAEALRGQLVHDVKVLVLRKLVAPQRIERLSRRRGYEHVAADLLLLTTVFRCHSHDIAGKCATTEEELARAEALAHQLTVVVSRRREPLEAVGEALDLRRRAFTLFSRAYSQVRRAVQYLRSEQGDADRFAPPLTGKRKGTSRKSRKSEALATVESAVAPDPVERCAAGTVPERVGLPGSDPFLN